MADNSSSSNFITISPPIGISENFTEMEELSTKGFNVLVRAKRFGQ